MEKQNHERFIVPSIEDIISQWDKVRAHIVDTPCVTFRHQYTPCLQSLGHDLRIKLELMQIGGSFKIRAALGHVNRIKNNCAGVTTASGGNHAVALSIAAHAFGIPATVVVPETASQIRIDLCELYGAKVIKVQSVDQVFSTSERIASEENYAFVHPFDGYDVALGTGGLAHEIYTSNPGLEAVIVPVGGGGLISGVANYFKQINPNIRVYGVEPQHANVISLSLEKNCTQQLRNVKSIADSLCAPLSCDYSFSIIQKNVDKMVLVSESQIANSVRLMQTDFKLAVEPAAACGLAALLGPLAEELKNFENIQLIACGSNIDTVKYLETLSMKFD